jgi:hypothetical protein
MAATEGLRCTEGFLAAAPAATTLAVEALRCTNFLTGGAIEAEAAADPLIVGLPPVEIARFSLSLASSTSTSLLKEIFFCEESSAERSLLVLPLGEEGA